MSTILLDVDDVGVPDCNGEHGAYSTESMSVKLAFTRDTFVSALAQLGSTGVLCEVLKTFVHETAHHLHNVTTPFGLLVHTLRVLQSTIVYDIAGLIRQAGLSLRFPIVGHLDTLPKPLFEQVEGALKVWYTAEIVVLRTFGETQRWRKHYETNPYVVRNDFGAQLEFLHVAIAVNSHFESLRQGMPVAPVDIRLPKSSPSDLNFDAVQLASEMMGQVPINIRMIFESAATVAEMWGSNMTLGEFRETVAGWRSSALGTAMAPYRFPIRYAVDAIGAKDLKQFIMSYLALCEAALFCPVLPEHRTMRRGAKRLEELTPILRWLELVRVAGSVKPIDEIGDYARYSNELCRSAGWATPEELAKIETDRYPRDEDPRRTLYRDSQAIRRNRPSFFIEYPTVLFGPYSLKWAFPVMEYNDRVLFHADKDFLARVRESYFARALSRRLLLRTDLRVPCPYRASAEQKQELTSTMNASLEGTWLGELVGFAIV
jgi:hypothetical protein